MRGSCAFSRTARWARRRPALPTAGPPWPPARPWNWTARGTGTSRARLTIPAGETLNLAGTLRNRNAGGSAPVRQHLERAAITLTGNNVTIDNAVPASGVVNSLTLNGNILYSGGTPAVISPSPARATPTSRGNIQTGTGGLTKNDGGTLTLSGSGNNYTGATTINGGTLALGVNNALPAASRLVIGGSGTFALGVFNQTLTGGLQLDNGGQITGTGTLTVNTGGITAQGGTISANLAGNAALTKRGAGTLTLSGDSSGYSGATTIEGGTLSGNMGTGDVSFAGSGATTLVTTGNQTINNLTGTASSKVQIRKGSTLTINNSRDTTFAGRH